MGSERAVGTINPTTYLLPAVHSPSLGLAVPCKGFLLAAASCCDSSVLQACLGGFCLTDISKLLFVCLVWLLRFWVGHDFLSKVS